jgi:hypothetical protein
MRMSLFKGVQQVKCFLPEDRSKTGDRNVVFLKTFYTMVEVHTKKKLSVDEALIYLRRNHSNEASK